jgi:putative acetyltransferase
MLIREERESDVDAIGALTAVAFAQMAFSDGTEPAMIEALRAAGDLRLSLVAEDGGVVGHVAFSPLTLDGHGGWFGLGPISVAPARQRQGIGSALVAEGLARLRAAGACGVALIGNPRVYTPMGFSHGQLTYRNLPSANVLGLAFTDTDLRGELRFAPALEA